jgi:hypothetical protein
MTTQYSKVSVTLPARLLERLRRQVGKRELSGYVARVLEEEERRVALRSWLAEQANEHGPLPPEILEEVRREWLGEAPAGH